jgi:hypothetical protein
VRGLIGVLLPLLLVAALFLVAGIPRERRGDRLVVGGVALLTRAVFAAGLFLFLNLSDRRWVFPDESFYLQDAEGVQAGGEAALYGYSSLLAAILDLTGPNEWAIRATNVVFGAAVAVVVYELVHLLIGRRAAIFAGMATALWPSLILWSSVVLKDPLVLLALAVFFLGVVLAWRGSFWGVVAATAGIALVDWMRPWAFAVASVALVLGLLVRVIAGPRRDMASFVALVVLVGVVGVVGGEGFLGARFIASRSSLELIQGSRGGSATGETSFAEEPGSTKEVIEDVPTGVVYGLIGPLPWQAGSTFAAAFLVVELAFWWTILVLAVISVWRIRPRRLLDSWAPLGAFAAGVVLVLAIYESNAGTALRQRAMIFPIVVALAAYVLAERFDRARS